MREAEVPDGDPKYATDGDYAIRLWRLPESVWPKEVADVSQKPADATQLEVENTEEKTAPDEPTEQSESPPSEESPT